MNSRIIIFLIAHIIIISCNTKTENKYEFEKEISDNTNDSISIKQNNIDSITKEDILISKLAKQINQKIKNIEKIDFDGDGIKDYICRSHYNKKGQLNEYWINSNFKIVKTKSLYNDDRLFRHFINLDNDIEPEIFEVEVFEDGADYVILDQDLKTGSDKIIIYYNPILIENNNYYWGYPWDVTNIIHKKEDGKVKLYCSLDHKITREGNEEIDPKNQKQLPVIFFNGIHTQETDLEEISNPKWLSLEEIIKLIEK